jgi:hypothetical protein
MGHHRMMLRPQRAVVVLPLILTFAAGSCSAGEKKVTLSRDVPVHVSVSDVIHTPLAVPEWVARLKGSDDVTVGSTHGVTFYVNDKRRTLYAFEKDCDAIRALIEESDRYGAQPPKDGSVGQSSYSYVCHGENGTTGGGTGYLRTTSTTP